ncbi:MAG TPA: DUF397 domain-containing protein [Pseudonocardiaceae bacterium]|jgi:hypothetical protein|nr:DUF397 domain-containing protein [Pseudonocardiaceae bacterium]
MSVRNLSDARWRKSSRSNAQGNECVEVAHTLDRVRDSKNPTGSVLRVEVAALLTVLKNTGPDNQV